MWCNISTSCKNSASSFISPLYWPLQWGSYTEGSGKASSLVVVLFGLVFVSQSLLFPDPDTHTHRHTDTHTHTHTFLVLPPPSWLTYNGVTWAELWVRQFWPSESDNKEKLLCWPGGKSAQLSLILIPTNVWFELLGRSQWKGLFSSSPYLHALQKHAI